MSRLGVGGPGLKVRARFRVLISCILIGQNSQTKSGESRCIVNRDIHGEDLPRSFDLTTKTKIKNYLVLSCLVVSCLVLSCLVLSCFVLSCLVLSCLAVVL